MFVMHIALQGCLRAEPVDYGITPDTGGHIRYLLGLVRALERGGDVTRQEICVRRFDDPALGPEYAEPVSALSATTRIVRLPGTHDRYLHKEDMAGELDALADALAAHVAALPEPPDVVHAHYADAGALAAMLKERLDIPYLFTAHSLGRSKPSVGDDPRLARRIALEERALAGATRVIASSIDEAELQYATYARARPEIIRVNPPGCDLEAFGAADADCGEPCRRVVAALDEPDLPVVLAIARPVARKNLAALVRAFGADERLRSSANLVIFAGNQDPATVTDPDARAVLDELERLIDDRGLRGRATLGGAHCADDVPGIYRFAAERRGVFANPALSEPFGLTLLEAAASGLPVVATRHGGPADIVGNAGNGLLVEPTCTREIADALARLLGDRAAWDEASARGREAAAGYGWDRHAGAWVADVAGTLADPGAASAPAPAWTSLLVCDIDETLTGCPDGLAALGRWLERHPETGFAIATGRSLHSALDVIEEWGIPAPRFLITSVGAELYHAAGGSLHHLTADANWPPPEARAWPRERVGAALDALPRLAPQGLREQRPCKLSRFVEDPSHAIDAVRALDRAGLRTEVIASHGRFLDVLPAGVSKGHAIRYVADRLGVPIERVWGAGDSGNDLHMLQMVGRPIVVGNCTDGLARRVTHPGAYFARRHHAGGVLEGLERRARASAA